MSGSAAADAVEAALTLARAPLRDPRPGAFLVKLQGQHKLATMTWLVAGEYSLGVEAFFCRQPDENHAGFYRFLLERNGRMYGVHFSLDPAGDVYLTGKLPLSSVGEQDIDRLLGCVLSSRRELRRGPGTRLRLRDPAGVGLAGQARREPGQPAGVRPLRRSFGSRGLAGTPSLRLLPARQAGLIQHWKGRFGGTLTTVNRLGELERAIMDVLWDTNSSHRARSQC